MQKGKIRMSGTKYVVWPEGRPDEAVRTDSWLRANLILLRMQIAYLFPVTAARRIRHASSDGEHVDPKAAEIALQLAGAIPPPGGWPPLPEGIGRTPPPSGEETGVLVSIVTHSVV